MGDLRFILHLFFGCMNLRANDDVLLAEIISRPCGAIGIFISLLDFRCDNFPEDSTYK